MSETATTWADVKRPSTFEAWDAAMTLSKTSAPPKGVMSKLASRLLKEDRLDWLEQLQAAYQPQAGVDPEWDRTTVRIETELARREADHAAANHWSSPRRTLSVLGSALLVVGVIGLKWWIKYSPIHEADARAQHREQLIGKIIGAELNGDCAGARTFASQLDEPERDSQLARIDHVCLNAR